MVDDVSESTNKFQQQNDDRNFHFILSFIILFMSVHSFFSPQLITSERFQTKPDSNLITQIKKKTTTTNRKRN